MTSAVLGTPSRENNILCSLFLAVVGDASSNAMVYNKEEQQSVFTETCW